MYLKKYIVILLLLLVGCSGEQTANVRFHTDFLSDQEAIKKIVKDEKKIVNANVIGTEQWVLVTYEVLPQYRIQKSKIETDLTKKLKKEFPEGNFLVSGDFKIYYESKKILDEDEKKVKKSIIKLKNLYEEET